MMRAMTPPTGRGAARSTWLRSTCITALASVFATQAGAVEVFGELEGFHVTQRDLVRQELARTSADGRTTETRPLTLTGLTLRGQLGLTWSQGAGGLTAAWQHHGQTDEAFLPTTGQFLSRDERLMITSQVSTFDLRWEPRLTHSRGPTLHGQFGYRWLRFDQGDDLQSTCATCIARPFLAGMASAKVFEGHGLRAGLAVTWHARGTRGLGVDAECGLALLAGSTRNTLERSSRERASDPVFTAITQFGSRGSSTSFDLALRARYAWSRLAVMLGYRFERVSLQTAGSTFYSSAGFDGPTLGLRVGFGH